MRSKQPTVEVLITDAAGEIPNQIGGRILVGQEGLISGTIGGGKLEARALIEAQRLLNQTEKKSTSHAATWNLQQDLGMTCGGRVTLFFDCFITSPWEIAVFGAGHVAQKLIPILIELDAQITCVDSRLEWLEQLPKAANLKLIHQLDLPNSVSDVSPRSYFVLITQGHSTDLPVALKIFNLISEPTYLGIMGSKVKSIHIRNDIKNAGILAEKIEKIKCPIGMGFGSNQPQEIALSIAAQLIEMRDLNTK